MYADPQAVIAQLNASPADRIAALRLLKNEVIGDTEKKRIWVQRGLIPSVLRLLRSNSLSTIANEMESRRCLSPRKAFTDDDTIQLQALQLIASLAHAGPAFISPLYASGVLSVVLHKHQLQNEHPEIVLAALNVIREIAVATASASPSSPITSMSLADIIFTDTHLESLHAVLSQRLANRDIEAQIALVAYLIRSLCREERHQTILVDSGILDALATRVASIAVAEGYVLPKAEIRAEMEGLGGCLPVPALSRTGLDEVLGAIAAIITDSPFRVCKLIYSPSILAIFPNMNPGGGYYSKVPPEFIALPGLRPTRPKEPEIMDQLLAETPSYPRRHRNTGALSSSSPTYSSRESPSTNGRPCSKLQTSLVSWTPPEENAMRSAEADVVVVETPLVPWLIHILRTSRGAESLMATSVLTSLFKTGFAYKAREASLGLLVIPVLMGLLEKAEAKSKEFKSNWTSPDAISSLSIIEEAPAVLARLITDSEIMQKAAYECNAVKMICKLLKASYDTPLPAEESRPWSPNGARAQVPVDLPAEYRLGEEGQHRQLTHHKRVRETTLRAIGALATFKEDYRKAIVDQEVVTYIIDSLSRLPSNPVQSNDQDASRRNDSSKKTSQPAKNPVSVVVAACYAIRMLSRSVKTLRTALVDHSVSKPLFDLLRHPEVDVQIAATECLCNLLPEFSPMRGALVEAGVVTVLCEHAHSLNSSLRLNALWALKHLVDSASIELKKQCVEELESGWLVRLICDDTEDEALFLARTRSERPSVSSASDDLDEDVDMGLIDEQSRPWPTGTFNKTGSTLPKSDIRILQLAESRLEVLREIEQNPIRKARHDDLAIQEQGLDFIRNLICGAHSGNGPDSANDTTEMIDYLLNTLSQDRLFAILASKLKPKVLHPFSRRASSGNETRVLPPQTKMIEAVIYILVHIAASVPRHRQLVIAQTDLLKQLAKLFNSQDREVRVALCHLINNLTWQDDKSDANACSQRAAELKNLGFLKKLEALGQSDDELDVRERAKSALWQMKHGH
ncbi:armadillo repeat protein [Xylaria sp. CBS 124048]|nr:armadillo repeat protein [Xylaria sp. CBS 124048]